jgi:hypothetical protein
MTDDMRRMAKQMMEADAETAGYTKPAPLVTMPNATPLPLDEKEAGLVLSMTLMSRTESIRPHIVSVGYDGVAWCTCRAKTPCWAIQAFCRVTGRPVYP